MLLSLPPELIQQILQCCDTSSFLQAALCCRSLLTLAHSSRKLVLNQLNQLPGIPDDGWDSLASTELFRALLARSREVLIGAEFYSESNLITFQGKVIDNRASSLNWVDAQNQALLVFKNDPTVYHIHTEAGEIFLDQKFVPPATELGQVEVLHTSIDGPVINVLHRVQPFIDQQLDPSHPFVKQALQSNPRGNIFLACHQAKKTREIDKGVVRVYGFPDQNDHEPLCFAAHDSRFVISWQHVQHAHEHEVVLYTMSPFTHGMNCAREDTGMESLYLKGRTCRQIHCSLNLHYFGSYNFIMHIVY